MMDELKILNLLQEIAKNTQPKQETQLILTGNKSDFLTNLNPPLKLDEDREYSIALVNLETYYSFPNIEEGKNNKLRYSPDNGKNFYEIELKTGAYEIAAINDVIFQKMKAKGHYDSSNDAAHFKIFPNAQTLKVNITLKSGYIIDFRPDNSLRGLFGFESKEYSALINESTNLVNIMAVNSILVNIDVIEGAYVNKTIKPVIYSFFPDVSPGYKIVETPRNLVYLRMSRKQISNINVRITDQDGKLLNLRGENITIRLHIKEV